MRKQILLHLGVEKKYRRKITIDNESRKEPSWINKDTGREIKKRKEQTKTMCKNR